MSKMNRSEAGLLGALHTRQVWHKRYEENPRFCKHCGKRLAYEKRRNTFCNKSCAASFNNRGVQRNAVAKRSCLICGKETHNEKYCSNDCFQKGQWKERVVQMEQAGSLLPCKNGVYDYNPDVGKRYLAETRGRKCELCGRTTWEGQPIPLILDHIDGNPTDHRFTNLRLVCGNCNMLLPTFAGRNRGKGRAVRYF